MASTVHRAGDAERGATLLGGGRARWDLAGGRGDTVYHLDPEAFAAAFEEGGALEVTFLVAIARRTGLPSG